MVSIEKIVQKFLQLDEYLGLLRNISRTPIKDFLNDRILVGVHRFRVQSSEFTVYPCPPALLLAGMAGGVQSCGEPTTSEP